MKLKLTKEMRDDIINFMDCKETDLIQNEDLGKFFVNGCTYVMYSESEAEEVYKKTVMDLLFEIDEEFLETMTEVSQDVFLRLKGKGIDGNNEIKEIIEETYGMEDLIDFMMSDEGKSEWLDIDGEEGYLLTEDGEEVFFYKIAEEVTHE